MRGELPHQANRAAFAVDEHGGKWSTSAEEGLGSSEADAEDSLT